MLKHSSVVFGEEYTTVATIPIIELLKDRKLSMANLVDCELPINMFNVYEHTVKPIIYQNAINADLFGCKKFVDESGYDKCA